MIMAIDPSYTNSGVCIYTNGKYITTSFSSYSTKKVAGKGNRQKRIKYKDNYKFYKNIKHLCEKYGIKYLCFCIPQGASTKTQMVLSELSGVIRLVSQELDIELLCDVGENTIKCRVFPNITQYDDKVFEMIPKDLKNTKRDSVLFYLSSFGELPSNDDISDAFFVCKYYESELRKADKIC